MNTTSRFPRLLALLTMFLTLAGAAALLAQEKGGQDKGAKEKELIEKLRSAPLAEKALACKELTIYGSKDAVPELAKLLSDEKLASWARNALEAIPGKEADEALRQASDSLEGKLLVGTINSIGVRRDAGAVERLTARLTQKDTDAASAAAVALGRIGNEPATKALRENLAKADVKVRSAVAEGCILCAERLLADGKGPAAAEIYDEVRGAEVPKQRIVEATRGAILARKEEGIPLLVEQLRSKEVKLVQIGLSTARELAGQAVADALAAEAVRANPEVGALILTAIGDRSDPNLPSGVLEAAKSGPKLVRLAAISVIGRKGDANSLAPLLETATDADAELSGAAKEALGALPGDMVNNEIAGRLAKAEGKTLPVLIAVVGQRRIDAAAALVKLVDHADPAVQQAALTALGETAGPKQLAVLIARVVNPKKEGDAPIAQKALHAACIRMADREACAAELAAALPKSPAAAKANLLEILGAMGGKKALETLVAAVKGKDEDLQDTGSKLLGEWMTIDAGPALLDLSKSAPGEKYQVRAMRGYIRIARQFVMPDADRAAMCQKALDGTSRAAEQKLVLDVLQRYPSMDTLKVAVKAGQAASLKEDASRVALVIAQKVGGQSADVRDQIAKLGLEPVKLEIVKAEYGAGSTQKDVTDIVRKGIGDLPIVALPSANYSAAFGGDPVPGTPKQLKIQYKMNGKAGEATFAENTLVVLPMPK